MKKIFIVFILSLFLSPIFAQEEAQAGEEISTGSFYFLSRTLIETQLLHLLIKGALKCRYSTGSA